LRRGKACLNCQLVVGSSPNFRPVCGQCMRVPKEDHCEYKDMMSQTQELEHAVHYCSASSLMPHNLDFSCIHNVFAIWYYISPFPVGDEHRLSPVLLYVIYLWGVHLSQDPSLRVSETVFLKCMKQYMPTEISAHTHPTHLLHTIQAQVLLSTYVLRNKHFLEAEFHANGAATLILSYHLHKICSSCPIPLPLGDPVLQTLSCLSRVAVNRL
ncbi:hypothetical protein B0H10DRAFT_1808421, partial [Mycena sp. CBHHK59/15]